MASITMKNLLEAGVHFGHQTRKWNPKMDKYIFGARNNIHIIDLQKTVKYLKAAYNYLLDESAQGKKFLFVGTKRQAQEAIQGEAEKCGMYFINYRWLGGTLTNFTTIRNSIKRLDYLHDLKNSAVWEKLSKKEVARLTKEYQKLDRTLCGIKDMEKLPDVAIVIDSENELTAIKECRKLGIPIVSIIDTDCNPDLIDVGVPGNDDAIRAIKLFLSIFSDAIKEGKELYSKQREKEETEKAEKEIKEHKAAEDKKQKDEGLEEAKVEAKPEKSSKELTEEALKEEKVKKKKSIAKAEKVESKPEEKKAKKADKEKTVSKKVETKVSETD